ncbi:hypothetical protein Clacol_002680 [Clathrus columnatus]|uniref:Uncharacterized protein n=1 Tax=Clathrus columnatus TaxID=1419009 RepID=A0AAV5A1F3_9AGAM|nr:hypothetical protein Clacol_002680 [Clathrus columnatus]
MGKLHLKETPEERLKQTEKSEHKHRKHRHRFSDSHGKLEKKRRRRNSYTSSPATAADGDPPADDPSRINLDELEAQVEDRRFREKLYDAMLDDYDNRLDSIEAQLNDYSHIPKRWKSAAGTSIRDDNVTIDPNLMDDDEYAEWVREGMWRRTHKAEIEEQDRREAEMRARKEREKQFRKESRRLEREAEAKRMAKRELKDHQRRQEVLKYYDTRWQEYTSLPDQHQLLGFTDIPWPVFPVVTTIATITEERISEFILYQLDKDNPRGRKERIREALLRWHPDKFESKLGPRLGGEKALILEGVGIVARCLNNMMNGG